MTFSMTGFGKAQTLMRNLPLSISIKSLNSKQLDLSCKIPSILRDVEGPCRELISRKIVRGKVDLCLSFDSTEGQNSSQDIVYNIPLIEDYYKQLDHLCRETGIPMPNDLLLKILSMPGVVSTKSEFLQSLTQEEIDSILQAVETAVDDLIQYRQKEGETLQRVLQNNIAQIRILLCETDAYDKQRIVEIRKRLEEQLQALQEVEYDPGRLEQELIYYIEKIDVCEEKNRLAHHLNYFEEVLSGADALQGKKLGFIAQEIGREINTLGSKSYSVAMQRIVVMMKDELEQIKEQSLNVL